MGTAPKTPKGPEPLPAIKVGDVVLDRYRVVEQIASGGHSVVFRGTDERLSRPVCIKVFSGLGGKSGVGRTSYEHFVQEAFALSRLTHPNTLRIYDFGHLGAKDAEGMPLQVCEYMNGGTLSQIVREQGKQSLLETVRVISAMCAALAESHALGIVHRDIKPQNILFGTVGGNRLPKLADFGIAKWSADDNKDGQRAEDTAIVAGQKLAMYSPSWAAPEQLAGQPVSAATDIYSLAVVAIYMLSGKAIFADEDVYAGYKKRRHADDLVRETLAPLGVPESAIMLFARALAFDPKQRLSRVDELAAGLQVALEPPTTESPRFESRDLQEATASLKPLTHQQTSSTQPPAQPKPPTVGKPASKSAPDPNQIVTPTIPNTAVTPPDGTPIANLGYPVQRRGEEYLPDRDAELARSRNTPPSSPPLSRGSSTSPPPAPTSPLAAPPSLPHTTDPDRRELPPARPFAHGDFGARPPQPEPPGVSELGYPMRPRTEDFIADRDASPAPATHEHPRTAALMSTASLPQAWEPPVVRGPWMASAPAAAGPVHRLVLADVPQAVGDRRVHFTPALEGPVDIVGGQASKLRVTFIAGPTGNRLIHIKGLTCFVAHLGGRPSPAVQLDQPCDIALVTPRAQEIGHVRVANGTAEGAARVFAIGPHRIALAAEDCSDPILFDFGPGSDAYFVYTRGRVLPKPRRR